MSVKPDTDLGPELGEQEVFEESYESIPEEEDGAIILRNGEASADETMLRGPDPAEAKTPKKTDADKRAAFSRLASLRASNALDSMRLLGHLANPSQYAWDEVQEAKLFGAFDDKLTELRRTFETARAGTRKGNKQMSLRL